MKRLNRETAMPGSNNAAGEAVWVPLVCTLLMLLSGIFYPITALPT